MKKAAESVMFNENNMNKSSGEKKTVIGKHINGNKLPLFTGSNDLLLIHEAHWPSLV